MSKIVFEGATITFTVVPHGYEANYELSVKEGRKINTYRGMNCRDFSDDDGGKFFRYLLKIAEREIRPDELEKETT